MSDKLREAIDRAEKENLATKGKDAATNKAKSMAKNKVRDVAQNQAKRQAGNLARGGKNLAKGAHNLLSKSKGYAKAAQMVAKGVSMVKNTKVALMLGKLAAAGGKILAFLLTPILGWVVSVILIIIIVGIAKSLGDGQLEEYGELLTGNESYEEVQDIVGNAETDEYYHYYTKKCPTPEYSPIIGDGSYASGDWTDEGSTAYNNAKSIFDIWVDAGLSGAAAAGVVGWTNSEGGFDMFGRAEGFYASNDPKDASLAYGHLPIVFLPTYPIGQNGERQGGGGVYQFTPYDKYAPLGSPDWEDPVKMHDYLFSVFRDELHSSAWMPQGGNDMTGESTSFEDFAKETNPERSVLMWNAYERANQKYVKPEQKKSDALFAYEAFGGANYTFDPDRFEATFGETSSGYEHTPRGSEYDVCDPAHSSGGSWRGAGGQPSITSGMWLHPKATSGSFSGKAMIPEELKEYALDPESVGLMFGNGSTWKNKWNTGKSDGGQCTHLTSNLAEMLWKKDGVPINNLAGNGAKVVDNFASKYGADGKSGTPTGGAIFSTTEGNAYCGTSKCGHTGIVSHVFDNGDFLVVETNINGYSGDNNSTPYTYNYRYITKAAGRATFTFYDPSKVGFQIVPGVKSL